MGSKEVKPLLYGPGVNYSTRKKHSRKISVHLITLKSIYMYIYYKVDCHVQQHGKEKKKLVEIYKNSYSNFLFSCVGRRRRRSMQGPSIRSHKRHLIIVNHVRTLMIVDSIIGSYHIAYIISVPFYPLLHIASST